MTRLDQSPRGRASGVWLLVLIIGVCVAIEAGLVIAGWMDLAPRLRETAYEHGGFFIGLLYNWQPNYALQPYVMFLTYGFLHAGLLHLVINMVTLWSLGVPVLERVGPVRFVCLYLGAMFGGGAAYAVLGASPHPMVGASGSLFGLAGALLIWASVDRFVVRKTQWPIAQWAAVLIVANLLFWWAMKGNMAWEAHLGGFVAGAVLAVFLGRRPDVGGR